MFSFSVGRGLGVIFNVRINFFFLVSGCIDIMYCWVSVCVL